MSRGRPPYKKDAEHLYPKLVGECFPLDAPGLTWSAGWAEAKKQGIGSKETYANCMKELKRTRMLLEEEGRYRRNPTLHVQYAENLRVFLRTVTHKATDFSDETFAKPDNFRMITGFLFNDLYRLYITMLNELVKLGDKSAAKELIDLFTSAEIQSVLVSYAYQIWQNRSKVQIVETLGGTRLEQIDSPVKRISRRPVESMAKWAKTHV